MYHWATDYARLLADLLLSTYDRGVSSYEWGRIEEWRKLATLIVQGQRLPAGASENNATVVNVVNWMLDNLQEVCPALGKKEDIAEKFWEFQLAMGVEFMRGSYRPDLTAPKRALGLVAAYDAILEAERTLGKMCDAS